MMYFAASANDSLSSKVMNDETMVSTVSPHITCPFLPPRHLSVSHVTVNNFVGKNGGSSTGMTDFFVK